jgi:hypothetical protein
MEQAQELVREIERAFAVVCRPEEMLHPECMDGSEIAVFSRYHRWEDIDDKDIASEPSALCFVSADGFQFLCPAYMRYLVNRIGSGSSLVDSTIYALSPSDERDAFQRSKYVRLSPSQRLAIRHFLEFMVEHAEQVDAQAASEGLEKVWINAEQPSGANTASPCSSA